MMVELERYLNHVNDSDEVGNNNDDGDSHGYETDDDNNIDVDVEDNDDNGVKILIASSSFVCLFVCLFPKVLTVFCKGRSTV